MQIVIPKSLAEPLTIPWEQISHDDLVLDIIAAMKKYMKFLTQLGWFEPNSHNEVNRGVITSSLRVIIRKTGGLDGGIVCGNLYESGTQEHEGYAYHVYFRTRKGGVLHDKLFVPSRGCF